MELAPACACITLFPVIFRDILAPMRGVKARRSASGNEAWKDPRAREDAMPLCLLIVLAGLLAVVLVVRGVAAQRRRRQAVNEALERLGFRPCLDQASWLLETVTRIENNRGFRYEVHDPKRRAGEPAVYYYVKIRHGRTRDHAVAEEEILFPLKRPSTAGLVLAIKPSSLAPGLATRLLGAVATGPWDSRTEALTSEHPGPPPAPRCSGVASPASETGRARTRPLGPRWDKPTPRRGCRWTRMPTW